MVGFVYIYIPCFSFFFGLQCYEVVVVFCKDNDYDYGLLVLLSVHARCKSTIAKGQLGERKKGVTISQRNESSGL